MLETVAPLCRLFGLEEMLDGDDVCIQLKVVGSNMNLLSFHLHIWSAQKSKMVH